MNTTKPFEACPHCGSTNTLWEMDQDGAWNHICGFIAYNREPMVRPVMALRSHERPPRCPECGRGWSARVHKAHIN